MNFIYETLDSALNSKSLICSGILGYLASKVITNQISIGYKELICLNALRNLNDYDIGFTIKIIEATDDRSKNQTAAKNNKLSTDLTFCEYTVQKLKNLQIVEEIHGGPGNPVSLAQSFWGTYKLSEVSNYFADLIKESGYYNEIKEMIASF